jgi:hypothetical protein
MKFTSAVQLGEMQDRSTVPSEHEGLTDCTSGPFTCRATNLLLQCNVSTRKLCLAPNSTPRATVSGHHPNHLASHRAYLHCSPSIVHLISTPQFAQCCLHLVRSSSIRTRTYRSQTHPLPHSQPSYRRTKSHLSRAQHHPHRRSRTRRPRVRHALARVDPLAAGRGTSLSFHLG